MGRNDNNDVLFMQHPAAPFDSKVTSFLCWGGLENFPIPAEYNGWEKESLSWKKTCYLHVFLSGFMQDLVVKGPDAEAMLSKMCVNNFSPESFKIGRAKHIIACAPNGKIIADGLCLRLAEDEFHTYNMEPVVNVYANSGDWDVEKIEPTYDKDFVFQIAGPRSLEVVENVIKQDVHDLKFMEFVPAKVLGYEVRVLRLGMGGTLSYEIHGPMEHIFEIYDEVMKVGEPYGMERLGILTYMCNHTEDGYPQVGEHFIGDWEDDPAVKNFVTKGGTVDFGNLTCPLNGSFAREGRQAYYLNPIEAGWRKSIYWGHDFVGKDALRKIADSDDTYQVVTLEWNSEDVLKVFASFLDDDPEVSHYMIFPQNMLENGSGSLGNFIDRVEDADGNLVGKSTGRIYTLYYKKVISMGFILPKFAKLGTELTVIWGNDDERQIPIRVKVARYPYLDLTPNKDFDVSQIPHFSEK
jgi:vanillate/3-O-methylgallate O-demethylase